MNLGLMHFIIRPKYQPVLLLITSSTRTEYLTILLKGRKATAHSGLRTAPCSSLRLHQPLISFPSFHFTLINHFYIPLRPATRHNATMAMEFQKLILCCYHRNSSPL